MIEFEGQYTQAQYRKGIRLAMHPRGVKLALRILAGVLAIADLIVAVIYIIQGEVGWSRIVRLVFIGVVLGWYAFAPYLFARITSNRPFRTGQGQPGLKGVAKSEGIEFAAGEAEIVPWASYLRKHVRDDIVALVSADRQITVLPREFFADENDWQGFRQLVEFGFVEPQ